MAGKWMGAWGKDFQRSCLYRILAIVIVVPLFVLLIIVPLYFANRPGVTETQSLIIMVASGSLFLFLLIGGSFGYLFFSIRRRAKWLDDIFVPLGLEGHSQALTGRQYHGRYRGREVNVHYYRGPNLSLYVSTSVYTQLSVSDSQDVSKGLANVMNKIPLQVSDPALTAFGHDKTWGETLLAEPEAQALLKELIFEEHPFYIRQVHFNPGNLMVRFYRSRQMFDFRISPEQGKSWLEKLFRIAELAESQPRPAETLEESALSEKSRTGKLRTGRIALFIVLAIVLSSICVGVIALLVIWFIEGGF